LIDGSGLIAIVYNLQHPSNANPSSSSHPLSPGRNAFLPSPSTATPSSAPSPPQRRSYTFLTLVPPRATSGCCDERLLAEVVLPICGGGGSGGRGRPPDLLRRKTGFESGILVGAALLTSSRREAEGRAVPPATDLRPAHGRQLPATPSASFNGRRLPKHHKVARDSFWWLPPANHKCYSSRFVCLVLTLINPVSVPQKIMSFAANKLVTLLPADSLPTFCCFSLSHIYHKFQKKNQD
jgi:hypothetical protein